MTRWAPLIGWFQRGDGWLAHPDYNGWLRSSDGRWWSEADVLEARLVMSEGSPRRVPGWLVDSRGKWVRESLEDDEIAEIRQRLEEVADG